MKLCSGGGYSAADRRVHANDAAKNAEYPDNEISNTKYTCISFIPKNLAEQFRYARDARV